MEVPVAAALGTDLIAAVELKIFWLWFVDIASIAGAFCLSITYISGAQISMKRILSWPIIFTLLLSHVRAQNKIPAVAASDPKELVGTYTYSSGFVSAVYEISADGKFRYYTGSDCCDPVWKELGSYSLAGNLLHFKVTTKTLNNYDVLDQKKAIEAYRKVYDRKGADVPPHVSQAEYDMQIVRWGERIYLVDPEKINLFAASVNFGIEPREGIISRNHLASRLFLRVGDQDKGVTGKPNLPEPWLSHLQDSPVMEASTT